MVFISTILSKINSPNSIIYSSYKTLQEQYIKRFKNMYKNNFDFLIVNIGTRIDREKESIKTAKIARAIKRKLKSGKKYLRFKNDTWKCRRSKNSKKNCHKSSFFIKWFRYSRL